MNLPLELVNEVLTYCQPNELCAVALANSNYRIEAERILYRSIVLDSRRIKAQFRTPSCLSTLVNNQSKANMVKSFEVTYRGSAPFSRSESDPLSDSLLAMRSLKHLKLNLPRGLCQEDVAPLSLCLLKQCPFSLATLHIPSLLLDDWILSQNQLEVLEMRHRGRGVRLPQDRQLSICRQLSMQNSSRLIVFLTETFGLKFVIDRIIAFPVLSVYTQWNAKDVADSLHRSKASHVNHFILVLESLSEEGEVYDVLTSLAENFPYLYSIGFVINDPRIHLHPFLFSSLLQNFSYLESIGFEYYGGLDKLTPASFRENHLGLAGSWATNCPKLREVKFPDGRAAGRDENGHWQYM